MRDNDFKDFCQALDDAFSIQPKWTRLEPKGKMIFFAALAPYSLQVVTMALTAHVRDPKRGQFQPTPADLVAQIENSQTVQRPGVEEAWALSFPCISDRETVVWTEEMRDAFEICRPLLEACDNVGARMAFKDSYLRLVTEAVRAGRPVAWHISQGDDKVKRAQVIEQAATMGRIAASQASLLLPAPIKPAELNREGLERIKSMVAKLVPAEEQMRRRREQQVEQDRLAEDARKKQLASQVAEYQRQHA